MEPKSRRIGVSWAGPYSGLLLGSIATFVITAFPDLAVNPLLFKLALLSFLLGGLMNLKPIAGMGTATSC